jgi:hypothetical protein
MVPKQKTTQAEVCTPVIPALRRLRQDLKCKISISYIGRP